MFCLTTLPPLISPANRRFENSMKTRFTVCTVTLATSLLFAGCAGTPAAPDASPGHPANAHAATSPLPPLETGLLGLTNAVVAQPSVSQPAPEHEHGHKK